MFKNILLATDFNPKARAARDVALTLVKGTDAKITILTVYDPEEHISWHTRILNEGTDNEMSVEEFELEKEIEARLQEYASGFKDMGIETDFLLETGNAIEVILSAAEEISADLIILGSHSRQSITDVLLGGTAVAVKAHASCPVIIASTPDS